MGVCDPLIGGFPLSLLGHHHESADWAARECVASQLGGFHFRSRNPGHERPIWLYESV